jgi:hypothetical protein
LTFVAYTLNYVGGFAGQNEFNVQSYSVFASNGGQSGADLYVVYNPDNGDPAIGKNLHWVQVIWNNWSSTPPTENTTGKIENIVDNGGAGNPYYDTLGTAGTTTINGNQVFNFYDRPGRPSDELAAYNFATPIQWMAEDFLVADTGKQKANGAEILNVYGGIEYGWQVTLLPEPSSLVLALLGLGGLGAYTLFGCTSAQSGGFGALISLARSMRFGGFKNLISRNSRPFSRALGSSRRWQRYLES